MRYHTILGAVVLPYMLVAAALSQSQPPKPIVGVESQDEVVRMAGHEEQVVAVAFSPDGRRAVSGSTDGTVRIWEIPTGALLRRIPVSWQGISAIAYSPDGRLVASSADQFIRLWDSQTGAETRQIRASSSSLAFSPDGKRLLSAASDRKVRLWDIATGEELRVYDQTMDLVKCVAFSPSGRLAVCAGGYYINSQTELGEMLRVWDLESGGVLFRLKPKVRSAISTAAFSPDGRRVAAIDLDHHGLGVWELENGDRENLLKPTGSIQDLAFTPNGRFILSGNSSNTLVLNEIESGRRVREYQGHTGPVLAVAVSGDGRYALSGSRDKTLRLWRLPETVGTPHAEDPAKSSTAKSPPAAASHWAVKPPAEANTSAKEQATADQGAVPRAIVTADNSDPVIQALNIFNRAQMELHNVNQLLPTYRADQSRQKEALLADVLLAKAEAEKVLQQFVQLEIRARAAFKRRFLTLTPLPATEWRVAVSQKPFAHDMPESMEIRQEQGQTRIRNDASSPACDAYLNYPLQEDTQLKIRFSFPRRQGPMYFGMRDERGIQQDMFSFPSVSDPDEVHEILLARMGDLYTGMYNDRARGTPLGRFKRFRTAPFAFFHVRGAAEIIIHSVHAQRITGAQTLAEPTGQAGKQSLSPLAPVIDPAAAAAQQDTVGRALAVLAQGLRNLHNINYLLPAYREEQSSEKQKLQADFLQPKEEAETFGRHFAAIADSARETYRKRFAQAPLLANVHWRAATAQQPLTAEALGGIAIESDAGKTVIRKESMRTTYHICLDYPLLEDTQLKIRFSLPARERRSGSPISPFGTALGIRDESGRSLGLFSFPSTAPPDEVHEIFVDRYGEHYSAMYKDRVHGTGTNQLVKFPNPPLVFFSISGPGTMVIHSVHAHRMKAQNE